LNFLCQDHEELRLPLGAHLRESEQRIGAAVATLLQRHAGELAAPLQPADVHDAIVIAKALIEADATAGRAPSPDLRDRVVRALQGYLQARPGPTPRGRCSGPARAKAVQDRPR
jgi:hypothetical protein